MRQPRFEFHPRHRVSDIEEYRNVYAPNGHPIWSCTYLAPQQGD